MEMKIEIPKNIEIEVNDELVTVKGEKGSVKKKFYHPKISLRKSEDKIIIVSKKDTKKVLATMGTWKSHLENLFKGVTEGFKYTMKISYVHFPMTVGVEGNKLVIKNFLGQKSPRYAKILEGVDVKINGNEVILTGVDREKVGQTAGNIENATRLLKKRDRRKFSDGIFIVSKGE